MHRDPSMLVTGGAGFIGSHLVESLVRAGHRTRVVDNLSTGSRANFASVADDVEFIEGDLRDADVCVRATAGVDVVFHVAALPSVPRSLVDPWGSHDANVNATMRLLEACRSNGVRRVVYSASSSAYGDTPTLPKVETMEPLPRSPYAASKLASEHYVLSFARAGMIEAVALRYFNVFGPRQRPDSPYAAVVPLFLQAALRGTLAQMYGDGEQSRDFTYVDNVVRANVLASVAPADVASGAVVNIGAGQRTTLNELLGIIRAVTGKALRCAYHPPRAGDVRDSLASLERAGRLIGYEPFVSLADGLRETWNWLCLDSAVENAVPGLAPARALAEAAR